MTRNLLINQLDTRVCVRNNVIKINQLNAVTFDILKLKLIHL